MNIEIKINPKQIMSREFATVELWTDNTQIGTLDFDYRSFRRRFPHSTPESLEFFYFTLIVYAIDKIEQREKTTDGWTRHFHVRIPVACQEKWEAIQSNLEETISFLTGDQWTFDFYGAKFCLAVPSKKIRRTGFSRIKSPEVVSLFSGGLDSLIGIIDWLEEHPNSSLFGVGFHDIDVSGPKSQQKSLIEKLQPVYQHRFESILLGGGISRNERNGSNFETSFRSRSIVFLGTGILCASQFGSQVPLFIPENGAIALNMPLTPARRGSLSTRTCHPFFIESMQRIIKCLGIETPLYNPLMFKTKGDCVQQCKNVALLAQAAPISVSCGKIPRDKNACDNKVARNCGRCVPCIFRRAALHTAGLDQETYHYDIFNNEQRLLNYKEETWNDIRSILSFIKKKDTESQIARKLIAGGPLTTAQVPQYCHTIFRVKEEIQQLIRDKGGPLTKALAGI
jgi:7-cyano-7-deazaguanine synthase in queuosine biosynthesis